MIENKVANSGLITLDLADWVRYDDPVGLDVAAWLYEGLILREKPFREAMKTHNWEVYRNRDVAVFCSLDAIIPSWAYLLLGSYLQTVEARFHFGDLMQLHRMLTEGAIAKIDPGPYRDARVIIKGCSSLAAPESAYMSVVKLLQPHVKSVMFGEACSTVPVYKRR